MRACCSGAPRGRRRGRTWPAASGRRARAGRSPARSRRAGAHCRRTPRGPGPSPPPPRRGRSTAPPPSAADGRAGPAATWSSPTRSGPTIPTRSPQPISRSTGPSRKLPRSSTAPRRRITTSPLRGAPGQLVAQVPALPRLLHRVEAGDGALGRLGLRRHLLGGRDLELADVLVLLVGIALRLRRALHRPLPLRPRARLQPIAFGSVRLVVLLRVTARRRARVEVAGPSTPELGAASACARRARAPGARCVRGTRGRGSRRPRRRPARRGTSRAGPGPRSRGRWSVRRGGTRRTG